MQSRPHGLRIKLFPLRAPSYLFYFSFAVRQPYFAVVISQATGS